MESPKCELGLDPASMRIMNIFKQDNIQTLRKENQTLRDRLRQFKDSDYKKTQELKSKNDEYYALQKELSNTLNRYKNQKADRTLEMGDLHEELEKRQNEIDRLNKQLNSEDRDTKNYKREIEINQKEISFLREETRLAKEKLAISEEKNVHIQDLHLKQELAETMKRQAETEKAHGQQFRHDAARVKSLEKDIDIIKQENVELRRQARDKAIAIENERLWKSRVNRIQPKCELLEEENERLQGDLSLSNSKIKRLEADLNTMRLTELKLTEEIGQHKADMAVGKSRYHAAMTEINSLKKELAEKKQDINLTKSAIQGDVDVSALRDQIKNLEQANQEKSEVIQQMRLAGSLDPRVDRAVKSYRFNPTHSRKKESEKEIIKLKKKCDELSRQLEANVNNSAAFVDQTEIEELKNQLKTETRTKEKVLELVQNKVRAYREVVCEVLGYDISSHDAFTFKFVSIYAQDRSDTIVFSKSESDSSYEMQPSNLFQRDELKEILETEPQIPLLMSKVSIELSQNETLLI